MKIYAKICEYKLKGFIMKRKSNLYQNIYDFNNILSAFNEVCRNTKNKKKVEYFKEYKCIYISRIYNILKMKNTLLDHIIFLLYMNQKNVE